MFTKVLIPNLAKVVERQDAVKPVAHTWEHFTLIVCTA